jgi:hypothetical protein
MSQTPLLGTRSLPAIPITATSIGIVPPSPLTSTNIQDIIDEIQTEILLGGTDMVPYQIDAGETFTVPIKKQALWEMTINVDAGGSLVIDGYLIMVT